MLGFSGQEQIGTKKSEVPGTNRFKTGFGSSFRELAPGLIRSVFVEGQKLRNFFSVNRNRVDKKFGEIRTCIFQPGGRPTTIRARQLELYLT